MKKAENIGALNKAVAVVIFASLWGFALAIMFRIGLLMAVNLL